jgi:hypothetical protein
MCDEGWPLGADIHRQPGRYHRVRWWIVQQARSSGQKDALASDLSRRATVSTFVGVFVVL